MLLRAALQSLEPSQTSSGPSPETTSSSRTQPSGPAPQPAATIRQRPASDDINVDINKATGHSPYGELDDSGDAGPGTALAAGRMLGASAESPLAAVDEFDSVMRRLEAQVRLQRTPRGAAGQGPVDQLHLAAGGLSGAVRGGESSGGDGRRGDGALPGVHGREDAIEEIWMSDAGLHAWGGMTGKGVRGSRLFSRWYST